MTAQIVMDVGGGPVVGSLTLPSTNVGDPVTLSNADNTGVSGWRWEILDAPAPSPTLNPLPPPTFSNTAVIANDVKGHTVFLRLTTYLDVGRTQIDDVDEQVIGIRFDPPFDWVIPAARQSIQANDIRGWAADVNRILRDVHTIIEVGTGSDWKQSARVLVDGAALAAHTRVGNVVTADGNGALPVQDGIALAVNDSFVLDYAAPNVDAGVYVVTALGDGSNPFVFTRRVDFDEDTEVTAGLRVPIEEGTSSGGKVARLITVGAIVVNTTPLDFEIQRPAFDLDSEILTNDATPINIVQLTPADDQAYTIWGILTAHDRGLSETAHWLFMLSGSRVTGITTVREFKILHEIKNGGLVAADFNVDLATPVISFEVTGIAEDINWRLKTFNFDAGAAT